jgi:hypothetical protein
MKNNVNQWWWTILYTLSLLAYTVFSYSLTAPNLVFTSWKPFVDFQFFIWETFFNNIFYLKYAYIGCLTLVVTAYLLLLRNLNAKSFSLKHLVVVLGLAISPLLISNNALSYDVFNYIFNAKMVLVYQSNPHEKVALNFAYDDWTRFMHNTHTPAPYGYGWTALSLIPYTLGTGRFVLIWMLFRLWSVMSLIMLALLFWRYVPRENKWWAYAVLLNPLLLIEVISTSHNDLWMMVPALFSLLLVLKKKTVLAVVLSLVLLLVSVSIKFATIVLLPLWFLLVCRKHFSGVGKMLVSHWALIATASLFPLLITARSQQFHPWYLTWILIWLPFVKSSVWRWSIIVLSVSSLVRYVPYLWNGHFTDTILIQQKLITWLPWVLGILLLSISRWRAQSK